MNLSQIKRQRMLDFLETIREQHKDDNNTLIAINEIENELTNKKYGLVWEEHSEKVDEMLVNNIPVFTEDKSKGIISDPTLPYNFLIEGDNLHSLKLLEKTHKGKIDVIYIDPPYNTGGDDFKFNDRVIAKEDNFRHSKWLSFMKSRLKIAYNLLARDGLIFISIDDNELSPLVMLCNEIFGKDKHLETIIWKNKYGAGAKTVGFISIHEYIVCFSKDIIYDLTSELDAEAQKAYNKKDHNYELRGGYLTQPLMTTSLGDRPNLVYDIEYNGDTIHPRKQWVWSKDRLEKAILNNEVEFNKQKDGSYSVRAKKYLYDENHNIRRGKPLTIFSGPFTQDGTKEIRNHFGSENAFKFAKPSELIRKLISLEVNGKCNKNAIILDFFAGSGTTAEAVLKLNKQDGGNRKFILCTNNENNICEEITYQRIKNVITGIKKDGSKYSDGIKANLKYLKTDFVSKDHVEIQEEILKHTNELIELKHHTNLSNQEYLIIKTDKEVDLLEKNISDYPNLKGLYIYSDVLLSNKQKILFKNLDIKFIPDYFYRNELCEIGAV